VKGKVRVRRGRGEERRRGDRRRGDGREEVRSLP